MAKYKVKVTYTMNELWEIEAESEKDAIEKVSSIPLGVLPENYRKTNCNVQVI